MSAGANVQPKTAQYVSGHHPSVLRSHTWRTAANSAAYLLPSLKPDMRILDVGCGPGTITADLAALVPAGSVVGLEPEVAASVLEIAKRTAGERGLKNIEFTTGDVHYLPFKDASFDVCHAHQVLQHIADPVRALTEMRRVVRPGGLVAVREADMSAATWYPDEEKLGRWFVLWKDVARANGGEPDAGRRLRSWARQAGFDVEKDVTCSAGTWCFATREERNWWADIWADRALQSAFHDKAIESGKVSQEQLEAMAAGWKEWADKDDAWFSVLHGEMLCST